MIEPQSSHRSVVRDAIVCDAIVRARRTLHPSNGKAGCLSLGIPRLK
jgi:hypothetical protein